jgi:signal transduction histidine kinase
VTVGLECRKEPEELCIWVRDDGPGIAEEHQRRIFDPFFGTKGSKGTGLGLAHVQKRMNAHGGRVILNSKLGEGTYIALIFPKGKARARSNRD